MAIAKTKIEERVVRDRYFESTGGRKTSIARARLYRTGEGFTVNGKDYREYFKTERQRLVARAPLEIGGEGTRISVHVEGGGIEAQAAAVRNAIAKALVKLDEGLKKRLRRAGFLTRDARMVERKKYGLKKARRAPQWQKR